MAAESTKFGIFEVPLDLGEFGFSEPVKTILQNMRLKNQEQMQYRPLDRSSEEIRILNIEPGITGSEIRCTLVHIALQEATDNYIALSYTWGSQQNLKHVYCNGKRLSVTSNLHFAMERCRDWMQSGAKFWIDAICINQQDIPEREAQVAMMASIYQHARLVQVVLGESDENEELIPPLIEKIHYLEKKERGRGWSVPVEELERHGLPAVQCPDWRALASLFSRPWFRRVWIVQEVANAKSYSVVYGNLSLDFKHLWWTATWINYSKLWMTIGEQHLSLSASVFNTSARGASNLQKIIDACRVAQAKVHKPLSAIFVYSRHFEASDHRDLVYALLGLNPHWKDSGFQISYAMDETFDKVLLRFATLLVERKETWDLLMHSANKDPSSTNLPSWVPKLGKEWRYPIHSFYGYEWNLHCRKQIQASVAKDGKFLTLRGKAVDVITAAGRAWNAEMFEQWVSYREAFVPFDWEVHARSIVSQLSSYPTGEPIGDVYLRTLTANRFGASQSPTSADLNRNYSHFLKWCDLNKRAHADSAGNLHGIMKETQRFVHFERMNDFNQSMMQCSARRILCVTQKGYMGLIPQEAREGDLIMGLTDTDLPLVFRRIDDQKHYKLLGDCYIHGYMTGELAKDLEDVGEEMILI